MGAFRDDIHEDRVERLDDACARQQRGDVLAAGLVSQVDRLLGVVVVPLIRGVDHDPPIPVRQALQRRGHLVPADREDHDIRPCRLGSRARRRIRAEFAHKLCERLRAATVAEDDVMARREGRRAIVCATLPAPIVPTVKAWFGDMIGPS